MTIWGHEHVKIEKDVEKMVWNVRTLAGAHLCTIPWSDVFKEIKGAPDYAAALATCMSNPKTMLTDAEERAAYTQTQKTEPPAHNVVAVDFKRKRRL